MSSSPAESGPATEQASPPRLPRVAIQFCTQCKWMLRAAYFAQELLSTFGPALGEVALQPATGGVFVVTMETANTAAASGRVEAAVHLLWDRKTEGGFPETKELKRRVRDVIEPGRDLGHVDRIHKKNAAAVTIAETGEATSNASLPAPAPVPTTAASEIKSDSAAPFCQDCQ
ncbi:hypothetical protein SEPCBS119000_000691 [Sporothrix epigloea]|uniref:Selenoprotein W family protein n=1 Tax=Sporothrix epigloea TaxID=1892477 RepID=A0ABP0D829_9PEZI